MSRSLKKAPKTPAESDSLSNTDGTVRNAEEIPSLEGKMSALSAESEGLLATERRLRQDIQQTSSQLLSRKRYTETIADEKLRLAGDLEKIHNLKLEELENALVTQAVEKDMCEESIAAMERDLDQKLELLRGTLSEVKAEEQEAIEKLNLMLSQIKSKLEHLNLTVTSFT